MIENKKGRGGEGKEGGEDGRRIKRRKRLDLQPQFYYRKKNIHLYLKLLLHNINLSQYSVLGKVRKKK